MPRPSMTVLSVDWDYFFPSPDCWDWGHREDPMYYEMLWDLRPGNTNIITKEVAIDAYHPNPALLDGFWNRTLERDRPWLAQLWLVESHKTMRNAMAVEVRYVRHVRGVRVGQARARPAIPRRVKETGHVEEVHRQDDPVHRDP
jgi:hypothetical protein